MLPPSFHAAGRAIRLLALCSLLSLAACGGEDDPPAAPAVSVPVPAVSLDFNGTPLTVDAGTGVNLTWAALNAQSCSATGAWSGIKSVAGTEVVTPSSPGANAYELSCTGAGAPATKRVEVTVRTLAESFAEADAESQWLRDVEQKTVEQN